MTDFTSPKPLAILTAIPEEIGAFGTHFVPTGTETVGGVPIHRGMLDGRPVVLAESGIGKVNGALATTILLDRYQARGLLFSGVAGGLDPSLSVGDLVVATDVIQHDYGALVNEAFEVFRAGVIPFPSSRGELALHAPIDLLARARHALAGVEGVAFGRVLTGDTYLGCGATRERLFAQFAAKAIDMESAAVAQVATAFGIPWLVFRALSDLAGEDSHLDFNQFVADASRRAAETVLVCLKLFDAEGLQ